MKTHDIVLLTLVVLQYIFIVMHAAVFELYTKYVRVLYCRADRFKLVLFVVKKPTMWGSNFRLLFHEISRFRVCFYSPEKYWKFFSKCFDWPHLSRNGKTSFARKFQIFLQYFFCCLAICPQLTTNRDFSNYSFL